MNYTYLFIFGFFFALGFRYILIYINQGVFKQGLFGDSSIHWTIIKNTKRDPDFKFIPQYLIGDEPTSYPRAFHRYAALFPLDYVKKYPWLPNWILFSVFAGLFGCYSYYFATIVGIDPISTSIVSYLIFILAVSNTTFDGPAIAYLKLSARLYARLFTSGYFITLTVGMTFWDIPSLILSLLLGSIAGTAATFGRQAMWFTTPLLALIAWSWIPIGVFLFTLLGSYLLSRRLFIKGVEYTIKLWITYNSHTKKSQVVKRILSNFVNPYFLLKPRFSINSLKKKIFHILTKEPTRLIVRYPDLIILLAYILIIHVPGWLGSSENPNSFLALVMSSLIIYALTTTKWLNHLGESYRYIEYNLTFAIPLLLSGIMVYYDDLYILAILLLTSLVFSYLLNIIFMEKDFKKDDLSLFLEDLNLDSSDVVFPVSMRLGGDICARSECKSFWWQPGNVTQEIFDHFIEEYPFLKKKWEPLAKEFDVNHVIVDKSAVGLIDWTYDFRNLKILKENEKYIAYKVNPRDL